MKRTRPLDAVYALTGLLVFAGISTFGVETAFAKPYWMRGVESNETDFLPPDVAFRASARLDGPLLRLRWVIADGYYLYKEKIEVKAESPDLIIGTPQMPQGTMKTDQYLGTQEIYTQQVEALVPYSRIDAGAHPIQIKLTYQGCAEAGLCYQPITKVVFPAPAAEAAVATAPPHTWENAAILGGAFAFLLAGFVLRKGRKLDVPV